MSNSTASSTEAYSLENPNLFAFVFVAMIILFIIGCRCYRVLSQRAEEN